MEDSAFSEISCSFGLCVSLGKGIAYPNHSQSSPRASPVSSQLLCQGQESRLSPFCELFPVCREYSQRSGSISIMVHFHMSRDHQNVQKLYDL